MPATSTLRISDATLPNSLELIAARRATGRIASPGPLLLLLARPTLWMTSLSLVALLFLAQRRANPWRQACSWWSVCFTLADVGCILGMRHFLNKEGLRLRDLLGPIRLRYGRDVFLGIGYFLLFSPGFLLGGYVAQRLFYGPTGVNPSNFIFGSHALPLWAAIYSLSLFWMINSVVEEATYQAYVTPRLQVLTGRPLVAFSAVAFFWAVQHCAIGFIPDWRSIACRFLGFVPGIVIMMTIYMRTRRLAPLILGHWMMDILAVLMCNVF